MPGLSRLRTKLLLLAAGSLLPVVLLAWFLSSALLDHERESYRSAAQARNRTFITALDAVMEGHVSTMRAMAAYGALQRGDLKAFDAEARRVLPTQPGWRNVLVVAGDGRHLVNARLPYGTPLPSDGPSQLEDIQRALASDRPVIGQVGSGPVSGFRGIPIRLGVRPATGEPFVLQVVLNPESLAKLLTAQQFPGTWSFGLTDANGEFIARVPVRPAGTRWSPDFAAAIRQAPEGWYRGRTLEGRDTYTAFRSSALTGWVVGVAIPSDEVYAAAWRAAAFIAAGAALSLLLAIAVAWWLGTRISRPIAQLAHAARHLGREPIGPLLDDARRGSGVAEVHAVAGALAEVDGALAERETLRAREQDALRAADKAKDEFLAMLGHELRNPLAAITASAHVLRLSKPDATAALKAHDVIDRQARQMTRLVEDLMDVSRLAMDKVTLHVERIDLAQLAERVVHTWQQAGHSRAGRVRLQAVPPTLVDADRARMEQVLANLLDNAHKFARDGQIEVRVRADDGRALLEVEDHGEGIDAPDLPRIFGLFVQGPQSFDRPQGGIGLGLALVRKLVELQHGTVQATSAGRGQGACFIVTLPLAGGDSVAAGGHDREIARTPGRRVLLVEDNDDGRQAMEMALALEGHTVRSVGRGLEAVEAAAHWQPDVALVDIGLPDIDGYEVARRIRALDLPARPRLVAITGFGQPDDQRTAYEAGFDLHLTKPVAPEFLRDVMQALTARQPTPAA